MLKDIALSIIIFCSSLLVSAIAFDAWEYEMTGSCEYCLVLDKVRGLK